jgi:hypothetical protein
VVQVTVVDLHVPAFALVTVLVGAALLATGVALLLAQRRDAAVDGTAVRRLSVVTAALVALLGLIALALALPALVNAITAS